jgi:hypothetical protein
MSFRAFSILAALLLPAGAFAQVTDNYQVRYAANLNLGDSFVNIVNAGSIDGATPAGDICVNVYTFRPNEEPINCCSCRITPDGLASFSVLNDLATNSLINEAVGNAVVIKLWATVPTGGGAAGCNAAAPGAAAPGLRAWGTSLHPAPGYTAETETGFAMATPSAGELSKLTAICSFAQVYGTGSGVCNPCRNTGLATTAQ